MFMYLDEIAEKKFPFCTEDVESVGMHDNAMFAKLRGGGEFKVVDIPESLTKQEFFAVAKAFKEQLDQIPKNTDVTIQ
jgi:hypothetical protein